MDKGRIGHFVEFTRLTDKELLDYVPPLKEKADEVFKYFKRLINGQTNEELAVEHIDLLRQDVDDGFLYRKTDKKIESSKKKLEKRKSVLAQISVCLYDISLEDLEESNNTIPEKSGELSERRHIVNESKLINIVLSEMPLKEIYTTLKSSGYSVICDTLKSNGHPI